MDDGVSGITIEGRIIRVLKPRESQYGWSQFVVVKDDTGEMGSNINIENEEAKYQGGEYIQVKGKISQYVKGGKPNVSLNGSVIDEITKVEDVSQEKPITQPISQPTQKTTQPTTQKEYTNNDYWYDKTLRDIENNKCIVRECAIKAVTEMAAAGVYLDNKGVDQFFKTADEIVDYINKSQIKIEMIKPEITITSEAIAKEFGGEVVKVKENPYLPEGYKEEVEKAQRIAKAQEIANPDMATKPQKDMVEKIIKSRYITEPEVKNIGDLNTLTKVNANKYISYWFGNDGTLGERDKRELSAKAKEEASPFISEREPIEKQDPNDDASLNKDLLIEAINKMRKTYGLMDAEKFMETIGCNTKFKLWNESELTKLKEKLEIYRPNWVKE